MALQRAEVLDSAYASDRAFMVERHLKARGIDDPLLLEAMGTVPRETFVPEHLQEFVYEDSALPIESGQTISQPYIVARMIELAEIKPGDKVLEVGAGSGYAAAVMSRMANKVFAIERHEELAKLAAARLKRLGYANAEIVCADGTKGLAEEAPFQAIIVSAGGPHVPEALKQQLAIGGRLVVPVGEFGFQTLIRARRTGENSFEEEDFGAVAFVPLIGEEGWAEPEREGKAKLDAEPSGYATGLLVPAKRALTIHNRVSKLMAEAAEPFGDLHELAIRRALRRPPRRPARRGDPRHLRILPRARRDHRAADRTARLHHRRGRGRLARRLGYRPPTSAIGPGPRTRSRLRALSDLDVAQHRGRATSSTGCASINASDRRGRRGRLLGLDVYSLGESIEAVLAYLDRVDPAGRRSPASATAASRPGRTIRGLRPRGALRGYAVCEKPVVDPLRDLLAQAPRLSRQDGEAFFDAEQNARIVRRRRALLPRHVLRRAASWNLRDRHMFDTLERLLAHRGPEAKAVVWAHNSHIGNAALTEMGRCAASSTSAQLCAPALRRRGRADRLRHRSRHGRRGVGLGRADGGQARAPCPRRLLRRPFRDTGIAAFLLETGPGQRESVRAARRALLERAIGVIYRPETELSPTISRRCCPPVRRLDLVRGNRSRCGAAGVRGRP